MDELDIKILNVLQENGRITNANLAQTVGLSPSATSERVRRLEENGFIDKYVAVVSPEKINKAVHAFVFVTLEAHHADIIEGFAKAVDEIEDVLECYHISGQSDYMLKVAVRDIPEYEKFLRERLTKVTGIDRLNTAFVLRNMKKSYKYKIEK
ncbi:MAG: Lrp/AsnC family transcriptional regulator [Bacteroidetes bacterium]|nr:Lrp/AsnC family transcriptional regulator [Bacteroidota bacterium]